MRKFIHILLFVMFISCVPILSIHAESTTAAFNILDPATGEDILEKYENLFNEVIIYKPIESKNQRQRFLNIYLYSPVELMIIDSQGRRSGYDPLTNQSYSEIPEVTYMVDAIEDNVYGIIDHVTKILEIKAPDNTNYTLYVTGTGEGTYTMEVIGTDANFVSSKVSYENVTTKPGQVDVYDIKYDDSSEIYEAEDMILENYIVEANPSASNGKLIKIDPAASTTGSASFTYTGTSGIKNISTWHYDTNDGASTYKLYINGTQKGLWTANRDISSGMNIASRVAKTLSKIRVNNGDLIQIVATSGGTEYAPIDAVEISNSLVTLAKVAAPVFSPAEGNYTSAQNVSISCPTSAAVIRYTTDGSTPNNSSPIYTNPIPVTETTTIKAYAAKDDMLDSDVASATYTINQAAKPVFSPPGGSYDSVQNVSISCPTKGAVIRYTLDGSTPDLSSPVYTEPITLTNTTTIKAYATVDGLVDSDIVSETYTIDLTVKKVENPIFSPASGTYSGGQNITISCPTSNAIIRYTVDHSIPNASSPIYTGPIPITDSTLIYAYAAKDGMTDSDIVSANYIITAPQKIEQPHFSPSGGPYDNPQTVTIFCAINGATIRYTTDGSIPDASSPVYTGPLTITKNTTIKAFSSHDGYINSEIATENYQMRLNTPTFSLASNTYNSIQTVEIACNVENSTIRYTTDGSTPDASSTIYSGPITISNNTVLKAYVSNPEYLDSYVATATYVINIPKIGSPQFSPSAGTYSTPQTVTIFCPVNGATIRYTTDGSNPDASSPIYTEPITIYDTTSIKAYASCDGYIDSDSVTENYIIRNAN